MSGKMVWWSTEPNWSTKLGDLLECLKLTLDLPVTLFHHFLTFPIEKSSTMALNKLSMDSLDLDGKRVFMR